MPFAETWCGWLLAFLIPNLIDYSGYLILTPQEYRYFIEYQAIAVASYATILAGYTFYMNDTSIISDWWYLAGQCHLRSILISWSYSDKTILKYYFWGYLRKLKLASLSDYNALESEFYRSINTKVYFNYNDYIKIKKKIIDDDKNKNIKSWKLINEEDQELIEWSKANNYIDEYNPKRGSTVTKIDDVTDSGKHNITTIESNPSITIEKPWIEYFYLFINNNYYFVITALVILILLASTHISVINFYNAYFIKIWKFVFLNTIKKLFLIIYNTKIKQWDWCFNSFEFYTKFIIFSSLYCCFIIISISGFLTLIFWDIYPDLAFDYTMSDNTEVLTLNYDLLNKIYDNEINNPWFIIINRVCKQVCIFFFFGLFINAIFLLIVNFTRRYQLDVYIYLKYKTLTTKILLKWYQTLDLIF